jgi:carboxypeptidase Taq
MLDWDQATMMPDGGADARAGQLAALKLIRHETLCSPEMAGLLADAEANASQLDDWQQVNLTRMRRTWRHATALPADLVEALSIAACDCEMIWRSARQNNDFKILAPSLEALLQLSREAAAAKGAAMGCTPYDALLDQFDSGATAAGIDILFGELEDFLPGFLGEVLERQQSRPAPAEPAGPFPIEAQRKIALQLMADMGFDFAHGRLDVSHHPFSGGVPDDARITTRYSETEFLQGLMAVLHETGHALYERGLPKAWRLQPVGRARGMIAHESQSLIVEMQACRSREFAAYLAPKLVAAFGDNAAIRPDNLLRLFQHVERDLIRVHANEVTYPLHVMLRYRLERAMISGDLSIRDLPGAWNDGMQKLLGLTPPDDADGCMQDVHWAAGLFGYFPTYTLGALAAAQFFAAATKMTPDIIPSISKGNFKPLMQWLNENVHQWGSRHSCDELLQRTTGGPLGTLAFKAHLRARYLAD